MRKVIGLLTLLTALGVFAAAASAATAAGSVLPSGATEVALPNGTREITLANGSAVVMGPISAIESEMSPLSKSQCSAHTMCVWEGIEFNGNFSQWPESNTGCHSHENNPKLHSGLNRTSYNVEVGGLGLALPPGEFFQSGPAVTGLICWPPR
jgi:hypothetical protein